MKNICGVVQMGLIGEILCKMAGLNREQLKQALKEQKLINKDLPLGQILLKNGYITESQLKKALAIQKHSREKDRVLRQETSVG